MTKYLYVFLILAIVSCADKSKTELPEPTGKYSGLFKNGNFEDSIAIDIERDSTNWKVFFSSLQQNANRIPFREVEVNGDSINFKLQSDFHTYSFKNKFENNNTELRGTLAVDTVEIQYALFKTMADEKVLSTEDIGYESTGLKLNGTIFYPAPRKDNNMGLIIVTSSGNSDRSASRAEAQLFAKRGFTTFIYDKRGTGISEGNWTKASIEELASDDINAIKRFSEKTTIPLNRIGIKGSSQGATKIPYILNEIKELKYGIAVSCPGTTLLESDLNYWKNRNTKNLGINIEQATSFERKVFETIAGNISKETLEKEINLIKSQDWYNMVWIPKLAEIEIDKKLNFTPIPYFEKTKQPVLIVQGSLDEIIPEDSHEVITEALKKAQNKNYEIVLLQGASHSMNDIGQSDFPYWSKLHPEYVATLENWINTISVTN
ncbi:MAG: prolyl oligopeptidase family serine peptidase [Eudoraea sp.]|nr:prolyl oligopeptidase family serine peptidase [Eudoraea sp.]MBT8292161.1 prolyl oligopeptidase family serine peptidase [Eudoraea sp.]